MAAERRRKRDIVPDLVRLTTIAPPCKFGLTNETPQASRHLDILFQLSEQCSTYTVEI
jgi:hypothetical protein